MNFVFDIKHTKSFMYMYMCKYKDNKFVATKIIVLNPPLVFLDISLKHQ